MRRFYAIPLIAACAVAASSCGDNNSITDPGQQSLTLAQMLPGHSNLRAKLRQVLTEKNGGLGFQMWATILDRNGLVVDVVFSGDNRGDQWPGSRVISAQKANTANDFSLEGFALSTEPFVKGQFKDDAAVAKDDSKGIWKGCFVAPQEYRLGKKDGALLGGSCRADRDKEIRAALFPEDLTMPPNCSIKAKFAVRARVTGNVGIYHLRGCPSYAAMTKPGIK